MHKRSVAGLSRLVICLQSDFIGTNFAGFCSNLGVRRLFSSPFVSYWAHIDWLAPGYLMGAGNPTISRETETQARASTSSPTRAWLKLTNGLPSFVRTYLLLWREEGRKRDRHGCSESGRPGRPLWGGNNQAEQSRQARHFHCQGKECAWRNMYPTQRRSGTL